VRFQGSWIVIVLLTSVLFTSVLGAPAAGATTRTAGIAIVPETRADPAWRPASRAGLGVDWDSGWGPKEQATGLPNPRGWYRAVLGKRTTGKVIYLTFDDGPVPGYTPKLLDLLDSHEARATFFVLGVAAVGQPALIKRMVREGHAVANHTWDHPQLTSLSKAAVRSQLRRTTRATRGAMGGCMRPPYGLINTRAAREALSQGLMPVLWTGHMEDWNTHPVSWYVARLRDATKPGAIILMHDTHAATITAVAQMLPEWRKQGYRLATIPRCR
jgi:peptidoglycan/xylan/chitin deacetylase (PgdA/CDA1 family)